MFFRVFGGVPRPGPNLWILHPIARFLLHEEEKSLLKREAIKEYRFELPGFFLVCACLKMVAF